MFGKLIRLRKNPILKYLTVSLRLMHSLKDLARTLQGALPYPVFLARTFQGNVILLRSIKESKRNASSCKILARNPFYSQTGGGAFITSKVQKSFNYAILKIILK